MTVAIDTPVDIEIW